MALNSYRDLILWQKSMDLAMSIYNATKALPPEEKYGLVSQMRRAAVSIPSNIAEGQSHGSTGEFVQFLGIAKGSLSELETQTELAVRLEWVDCGTADKLRSQQQEVGRLLNGLLTSLRAKT